MRLWCRRYNKGRRQCVWFRFFSIVTAIPVVGIISMRSDGSSPDKVDLVDVSV